MNLCTKQWPFHSRGGVRLRGGGGRQGSCPTSTLAPPSSALCVACLCMNHIMNVSLPDFHSNCDLTTVCLSLGAADSWSATPPRLTSHSSAFVFTLLCILNTCILFMIFMCRICSPTTVYIYPSVVGCELQGLGFDQIRLIV